MVFRRHNFTLAQFIERKSSSSSSRKFTTQKSVDEVSLPSRKSSAASAPDLVKEFGDDQCHNCEGRGKSYSPFQRKMAPPAAKENYWYYDSSSDGIYYEFNGVRGWRKRNTKMSTPNGPQVTTNGKKIKPVDENGYFFESPSAEGWRRRGGNSQSPQPQPQRQQQQHNRHHYNRRPSTNIPQQSVQQVLGISPSVPVPSKWQPFGLQNVQNTHTPPPQNNGQFCQPKEQEQQACCTNPIPSNLCCAVANLVIQLLKGEMAGALNDSQIHTEHGSNTKHQNIDEPAGAIGQLLEGLMRQNPVSTDLLANPQWPIGKSRNPWEPRIDECQNQEENESDTNEDFASQNDLDDWSTNGYESPLFTQLSTIRQCRPSTDLAPSKFDMDHIEAGVESLLNLGGDETIGEGGQENPCWGQRRQWHGVAV